MDDEDDEDEMQHVKTDQAELPYQNDDGTKQDARIDTGDKTSELDNPSDATVVESPEEDPNSTDETANDLGTESPRKLHGKALLNNFLDEEGVKQTHSSKITQSVPQGSNTGPHNSQVLSAEADDTESDENLSDDENSDVPQYSAKLIDGDDPSMENTKHWQTHLHMKKVRQKFNQMLRNRKPVLHYTMRQRHKNHKSVLHYKMRQRHKPAVNLIMKAKHKQQDPNIHNLQRMVNTKFTKQKTVANLQQNTTPKAVSNLERVPNADAYIRGAMRNIPSQIIHVVKTQPKPEPMAQKSGANAATVSNGTAVNEELTSVMPTLQKVQMEVNSQGTKETTSPQEAKFIEKQTSSNDQKSSSAASSGGGGGGGGGLETSDMTIPSSQVAAQSLLGEDKVSNLNGNSMTSPSDGAGMTSSSDVGMTSSSAVDRMASSTDPTDLTEYEHNIDIAERTGAGDIVPVGVGTNNPTVTPVSNNPENTPTTAGQGAPPEHVLFSQNSAKGEDLLKPLANDPDGKLAAIQDIRALTKVQNEQESSATQDTEKISDPAFLEGMSNRISLSGAPLESLGIAHTPSIPLRDIDQPGSTLMVPGDKLKRDEKGLPQHKTSLQEKNAQFRVDNKVVALGTGSDSPKLDNGPKTGQINSVPQVQQLAGNTPESGLATQGVQAQKPTEAAQTSPQQNPDISYNLAPKVAELVKEIVKESLGNGHVPSNEKTAAETKQNKGTEEIFDGPSKEGGLLLKSETMETKPYDTSTLLKNLRVARKGSGASPQVNPQSHNTAGDSKTSLFLPNVPANPEGDRVFFDGESQSTDTAGTMNKLSKSNLSKNEKIKLIKAYQDIEKTSPEASTRNNPSKSPTTTPEVDESKINELLKDGKFNEHDLKSDFAGKEAAMQDMMLLEKERDMDDKLSQVHLMAAQQSKLKGPGNKLPAGGQRQNGMSLPGNLSPDITLPGNISPGASLPETLPAGTSLPGNGLSSDVALPDNRLPGPGNQGQMSGFQGQIPGSGPSAFSKGDSPMMAKETQMYNLLDQAQTGMPKGLRGENNAAYGLPKSRKVRKVVVLISFDFHQPSSHHSVPRSDPCCCLLTSPPANPSKTKVCGIMQINERPTKGRKALANENES
jgi:hypothetical protein